LAAGSFGTGDGLTVQIVATVLVAGLLLPVRGRLQRRVDRLFFGDRGSPYAAMARLGRQVEEATTASPVLESVVTVVAGSLRLPYAAVQLPAAVGRVTDASWGHPPAEVAVFPLTFQRETVGRLLVGHRTPRERLSPDDERLLASLARQVAPAADAVALRRALDASRTGSSPPARKSGAGCAVTCTTGSARRSPGSPSTWTPRAPCPRTTRQSRNCSPR
jgi:two-component system, NarL family, sensor kinase